MKACFQIFKAPFYFVGWLAPAYGKDEVNSTGSLLKIRKKLIDRILRIFIFIQCTTFAPLSKAHYSTF